MNFDCFALYIFSRILAMSVQISICIKVQVRHLANGKVTDVSDE